MMVEIRVFTLYLPPVKLPKRLARVDAGRCYGCMKSRRVYRRSLAHFGRYASLPRFDVSEFTCQSNPDVTSIHQRSSAAK